MTWTEDAVEFVKHAVGKTLTVGFTVLIAEGGIGPVVSYFVAPSPEAAIVFKGAIYYASYKAFKDGLVPFVDDAYAAWNPRKAPAAQSKAAYFA